MSNMDKSKMKDLEVGDKVAIVGSSNRARYITGYARVERLTKTQIILNNGERYRLKDRELVGFVHVTWGPFAPTIRSVEDNYIKWMQYRIQLQVSASGINTMGREIADDPTSEETLHDLAAAVSKHLAIIRNKPEQPKEEA